MIVLVSAYVLDLILGDPSFFYHPVRLIGHLVAFLEKYLLRKKDDHRMQKWKGLIMTLLVGLVAYGLVDLTLSYLSGKSLILGKIFEIFLIYQILATRSLDYESHKVYKALKKGDLDLARSKIAMLVSRDTAGMEEADIIKATVETISENLCDGMVAPLLFIALGGAPLGMFYKAINTMDSMVGYKNDKYIHFGYASAKLDDILNYIPARLSALIILTTGLFLAYDLKEGIKIVKRDKRNHASPNSGYPEAAVAGLLGLQLGGRVSYFGKMQMKPTIGDEKNPLDLLTIEKTRKILYLSSFLTLVFIVLASGGVYVYPWW